MKKLIFLCLLFSSSLFGINYFAALQKYVQQYRIDPIKNILKQKALTITEKQILLEQAHQNVLISKTELDYFTSNNGLKRKVFGCLLASYGTCDTLVNNNLSTSLITCACGYLFYKWGKRAEHGAMVEGKINAIKKYETALIIEQLISNATVHDDPQTPQ